MIKANRESSIEKVVALSDCPVGAHCLINAIDNNLACGQRLRELGIVEGAYVLLLKQSDPLLVMVMDSRIAIDPLTAKKISVTACNGNGANGAGFLANRAQSADSTSKAG